jgi:hypothetical protein
MPNDAISSVFDTPLDAGWTYDATRGYYTNTAGLPSHALVLPGGRAWADLRRITATFWSDYQFEGGQSLAVSYFNCTLDDATEALIGTGDFFSDSSRGQNIYKGDAGIETEVQRTVEGETYTYTVPEGRTVSTIVFRSGGTVGYTRTLRGVKDIIYKFS